MEHSWNPNKGDCIHCGLPVRIRNPSGYCDHLYYPDRCEYCKKVIPLIEDLLRQFDKAWREMGEK